MDAAVLCHPESGLLPPPDYVWCATISSRREFELEISLLAHLAIALSVLCVSAAGMIAALDDGIGQLVQHWRTAKGEAFWNNTVRCCPGPLCHLRKR